MFTHQGGVVRALFFEILLCKSYFLAFIEGASNF